MRVCQFRHFGTGGSECEVNSLVRKQNDCTGSEVRFAIPRSLFGPCFSFPKSSCHSDRSENGVPAECRFALGGEWERSGGTCCSLAVLPGERTADPSTAFGRFGVLTSLRMTISLGELRPTAKPANDKQRKPKNAKRKAAFLACGFRRLAGLCTVLFEFIVQRLQADT